MWKNKCSRNYAITPDPVTLSTDHVLEEIEPWKIVTVSCHKDLASDLPQENRMHQSLTVWRYAEGTGNVA